MKRSEIINVIEEYLCHTEHLNIPCSLGSDFKSAAKDIIVLLENAGMLPPEYVVDYSPMITTNAWEPEDD